MNEHAEGLAPENQPQPHPLSDAFYGVTHAVHDAVDRMWAQQADPIRVFDLFRTGAGAFVIKADGPNRIVVEFVKGLSVEDPPEPGTGSYL